MEEVFDDFIKNLIIIKNSFFLLDKEDYELNLSKFPDLKVKIDE